MQGKTQQSCNEIFYDLAIDDDMSRISLLQVLILVWERYATSNVPYVNLGQPSDCRRKTAETRK
jgi:hypothetical protein